MYKNMKNIVQILGETAIIIKLQQNDSVKIFEQILMLTLKSPLLLSYLAA